MTEILASIGLLPLIALLLVAFFTSMIHGATGIAGGFLLAAFAAPILGLKNVVPVLSITLLISHGARAFFNANKIDWQSYLRVMLPAVPCTIVAALAYGRMSNASIALLLGTVVLLSIPLRRWTQKLKIKTSKSMLMGAGSVYGTISGMAIGPGMLLMPILLGVGMKREAFVATLATIALTTNIVRASVYGVSDLLNPDTLLLGVLLGLATIPGTWVGRGILRNMTDAKHIMATEWLVVLGGLNFYWMAYRMMTAT